MVLRELSFLGFLKQYIHALSLAGLGGYYKLASEAATVNPRLREPLLLHALFSGKESVLLAAVKSTELHTEYVGILDRYDRLRMEQALQNSDPLLPDRYVKVYRSYIAVKNKHRNEEYTKSLIREQIIRLQRDTGVSTYRLYTDLQVNPGNMNAFIKHGDCSKVSLAIARSAMAYMENISASNA